MKKLTVKRQKSFAGCAMKMNIYIQDELAKEVIANGSTFRKLGAMKMMKNVPLKLNVKSSFSVRLLMICLLN